MSPSLSAQTPIKIAIAGFQHETNCFNPNHTSLVDFEMADSWPRLLLGQDVIDETQGMNLPIAGFIAQAQASHAALTPILWCAAEPAGMVTSDAFDQISGQITSAIGDGSGFDAIYLDLHGAMVTDAYPDGEGELLQRLRQAVGDDIPIVISLDLHANISPAMVKLSTAMTIFRTYPHLDMAASGARAFDLLSSISAGRDYTHAFSQLPFLIPLHAQCTDFPPLADLYAQLDRMTDRVVSADIALGFTSADYPDTRPSIVVYADAQDTADAYCQTLTEAFLAAKDHIDLGMMTLDEAAVFAKNFCQHQARKQDGDLPVVFADVQDNPGGGASADTIHLMKTLVEAHCPNVLMGLLCDAELARIAHHNGVGAHFTYEFGHQEHGGLSGKFTHDLEVIALSDGQVEYSGEMYGGGMATMGKTAALRLHHPLHHPVHHSKGYIDLVVTTIKNQCLDLAQFMHIGLNPSDYQIICVKSTVHFRAAFAPISQAIYAISAPALMPCDLSKVNYQNLAEGVEPLVAK